MVRRRYLIGLAPIIKHLSADNFLFLNTASGLQIKIDKMAALFYHMGKGRRPVRLACHPQ